MLRRTLFGLSFTCARHRSHCSSTSWILGLRHVHRASTARQTATPAAAAHQEATASSEQPLDFSDPRQVFGNKSMPELLRAALVLKLCSLDVFVDNALPLLGRAERVLGERLLHALAGPLYRQFVPGVTEADLARAARQLRTCGVRLVFAHMLEDDLKQGQTLDSLLDANLSTTLHQFSMVPRIMERCERPCTLLKLTGLVPCHTLTRVSDLVTSAPPADLCRLVEGVAGQMAGGPVHRLPVLSPHQQRDWDAGLARVNQVGEFCETEGVRVMVDGEYTYTNPAIALLTLALAVNFNQTSPLVWGTYQCYLKDAEDSLNKHLDTLDTIGVCYGVKLVRGAYLEKEVAGAIQLGLPRPIHDTYELTSDMYNSLAAQMLQRVAETGDRTAVILATHNETSIRLATGLMDRLRLPRDDGRVLFGQTYGVYEQVSVPLASAGYAVYKSTPLGPISSLLPYLARRAAENRTVAQGTRSERKLLGQEIRRRLHLPW